MKKILLVIVTAMLCRFAGAAEEEPGDVGFGLDRKIQPGDVILIEVAGEKTFSVERKVPFDGMIPYPYLGRLEAGGQTPDQLAVLLTVKLGEDYLVNPQVSILVKETLALTASVLGAVNKPGPVQLPIEKRIDVIEAIAQAGGFSEAASRNRIEFSRGGKKTPIKYDELLKSNSDPTKKIYVQPGDIIWVYESRF